MTPATGSGKQPAAYVRAGDGLEAEVDQLLDQVLGLTTTEYRIRGRINGVLVDITIDPLHFARRLIKDAFLEAWSGNWVKRAEAFAYAGRPDIAGMCLRHADLLAEGDPWEACERGALAFLDEFDARWHQAAG